MTATNSCVIFSIEGNIGSGKSTFIKYLKEELSKNDKIIFLPEPVDQWTQICDDNGKNMIEKFYENQEKYAFSFQMMAYISRIHLLRKTIEENPGTIIISERCVDTDKNVFAKMLYDDNMIEKVNYDIYLRWFDEFTRNITINELIYIQTDPTIADNRVKRRARQGETIPINYLSRCHNYHEEWLNNTENVHIFDGSRNIYDPEDRKHHISHFYTIIDKYL